MVKSRTLAAKLAEAGRVLAGSLDPETTQGPQVDQAQFDKILKYINLGRALVGVRDLMGVAWLIKRSKLTDVRELE